MKISPLNKYYFDKSYIVDKHNPYHDKRKYLHTLISEKQCFCTPKRATCVTCRLKKQKLFTCFSGCACVRSHTWLAPRGAKSFWSWVLVNSKRNLDCSDWLVSIFETANGNARPHLPALMIAKFGLEWTLMFYLQKRCEAANGVWNRLMKGRIFDQKVLVAQQKFYQLGFERGFL